MLAALLTIPLVVIPPEPEPAPGQGQAGGSVGGPTEIFRQIKFRNARRDIAAARLREDREIVEIIMLAIELLE